MQFSVSHKNCVLGFYYKFLTDQGCSILLWVMCYYYSCMEYITSPNCWQVHRLPVRRWTYSTLRPTLACPRSSAATTLSLLSSPARRQRMTSPNLSPTRVGSSPSEESTAVINISIGLSRFRDGCEKEIILTIQSNFELIQACMASKKLFLGESRLCSS